MQEQLPKQFNIPDALTSHVRRIYSNKYIDRFPDTNETEFQCPCCGKTMPIRDARIKGTVRESNSVRGRFIYTTTERFAYRVCTNCMIISNNVEEYKQYAFWIAYCLCIVAGIICSFTMGEVYPAIASLIAGWMFGYIFKVAYIWIATLYYGWIKNIDIDISYNIADSFGALIK